jgi:hypothetical protein
MAADCLLQTVNVNESTFIMKTSNVFPIIIALLFRLTSNAQNDSAGNRAQFKMGLFYNSHLNYYGRTDSLQSSGVFPLAELWFSKNVYINAAPVFVNNVRDHFQYAGTVTTLGYQFNDQQKWAGNFYVVKPFYKSSSQLVQSALKAQVAATVTWQSKTINITGGGDVKFSDNADFGLTAGLDHPVRFMWPGKGLLVLDPTATINAGTQQFSQTYYKKNNFLLFSGPEQAVEQNVRKFNILSYELSMPLILAKGKFQFLLIPAYVIPQNLVTVSGRPDLTEFGGNLFYITAGFKVIF